MLLITCDQNDHPDNNELKFWALKIRSQKRDPKSPFRYRQEGNTNITTISPAPGSVLDYPSIEYRWTPIGNNNGNYRIEVGTTKGGNEIYKNNSPGNYLVIKKIPLNGKYVYFRLGYKDDNIWKYLDYQYKTAKYPFWPATNQTLKTPQVTFNWVAMEDIRKLYIAVTNSAFPTSAIPKTGNLFGQAIGKDVKGRLLRSISIRNLPTDGSPIYVRFWFETNRWYYVDYIYNQLLPRTTYPELNIQHVSTISMNDWEELLDHNEETFIMVYPSWGFILDERRSLDFPLHDDNSLVEDLLYNGSSYIKTIHDLEFSHLMRTIAPKSQNNRASNQHRAFQLITEKMILAFFKDSGQLLLLALPNYDDCKGNQKCNDNLQHYINYLNQYSAKNIIFFETRLWNNGNIAQKDRIVLSRLWKNKVKFISVLGGYLDQSEKDLVLGLAEDKDYFASIEKISIIPTFSALSDIKLEEIEFTDQISTTFINIDTDINVDVDANKPSSLKPSSLCERKEVVQILTKKQLEIAEYYASKADKIDITTIHDAKRENLKNSFNLFFSCDKEASDIFYISEPTILAMRFYTNSINLICSDFQILDNNLGNIISYYPMNLIANKDDWKNSIYTPSLYFKPIYIQTPLQLEPLFNSKKCFNFEPSSY